VGFQLVREIEYDNAVLLVLLLTMYNRLIPSPIIVEVASFNLLTLVVFGSLAPIKKNCHGASQSRDVTFSSIKSF